VVTSPAPGRYSTFAALAGADPTDHAAAAWGLPPLDSLDCSALVAGANLTSPRADAALGGVPGPRALVTQRWKLLLGDVPMSGWTGPSFPNASSMAHDFTHSVTDCAAGCLFDVESDRAEHHDVAADHPETVARLTARLAAVEATAWAPHRGTEQRAACDAAAGRYHGFYGPFADLVV